VKTGFAIFACAFIAFMGNAAAQSFPHYGVRQFNSDRIVSASRDPGLRRAVNTQGYRWLEPARRSETVSAYRLRDFLKSGPFPLILGVSF
jgi:hypothetical protein